MNRELLNINGAPHIVLNGRAIPVEMKNGVPVIRAQAEEVPNGNGGTDVIVRVPCLQISGEQPKTEED